MEKVNRYLYIIILSSVMIFTYCVIEKIDSWLIFGLCGGIIGCCLTIKESIKKSIEEKS